MMRSEGSPPREKLVAFLRRPGPGWHGWNRDVSFEMPQFNGTVRVNAVAWSRKGGGACDTAT
jgi:uncharacterized protein YfaS (alpha-2-macroglobulin family)